MSKRVSDRASTPEHIRNIDLIGYVFTCLRSLSIVKTQSGTGRTVQFGRIRMCCVAQAAKACSLAQLHLPTTSPTIRESSSFLLTPFMRAAGNQTHPTDDGKMAGQTHFRFLDLPPELRERIYALLFVFSRPILISPHGKLYGDASPGTNDYFYGNCGPYAIEKPRISLPSVSRANHLLRCVCLAVFYGQNHFNLGRGPIQDWLRILTHENISNMRHIVLEYNPTDDWMLAAMPPAMEALLRDCTVSCGISLVRHDPWYTIHISYKSARYKLHGLEDLQEKMRDFLRQSIRRGKEPMFSFLYLIKLFECWLLWCERYLTFDSSRPGSQYLDATVRHRRLARLQALRSQFDSHVLELFEQ